MERKGCPQKLAKEEKKSPASGFSTSDAGGEGAMPSKKNQFNLELDSPLNSLKHEAKWLSDTLGLRISAFHSFCQEKRMEFTLWKDEGVNREN